MDIYPDMIGEGEAVIGYTMDGNDVAFPYTAEVPYRGSYEKYRASEIGLDPIIVRGRKALDESMATQAWIGKGFHGDVTDGHECNSTLVLVEFASDVTDIGDYALAGCSALTKIVIPKVLPAQAGVFLKGSCCVCPQYCSSRGSGDVSRSEKQVYTQILFFPRERGCFYKGLCALPE